jgi:hypothetical protein
LSESFELDIELDIEKINIEKPVSCRYEAQGFLLFSEFSEPASYKFSSYKFNSMMGVSPPV